ARAGAAAHRRDRPAVPAQELIQGEPTWLPRNSSRSTPTASAPSSRSPTTRCTSPGGIFEVDPKRLRLEELESLSSGPTFWDNHERAQGILREAKEAKVVVATFDAQVRKLADAIVLLELAEEAQDVGSALEARQSAEEIRDELDELEFRRMLSGQFDTSG